MKIKSKGSPIINGITLKVGLHNYPTIDHKDPLTALQLNAVREIGVIEFDELIDPKPAQEALDDPNQELVIDSEKTFYEDGPKKGERKGVNYKGSAIKVNVDTDEKKAKDVTKPDKPAEKPAKKDDKNKSEG